MEDITNKDFLKSLLINLKKPIPHQWRVQSYSKNKPSATVMAYIDARDAQEVLDMYCDYGWHRDHFEVDGKVYCKVGVVMPDGSIQWRSDCGTESQSDAEKGQSSDSFKRACVNFGVGRFLYDLKIQYVDASAIKEDQKTKKVEGKVYAAFPYPVDEQGRKIYNLTEYINNKNPNTPSAPSRQDNKEEAIDNRPVLTDLLLSRVIGRIKKGEKGVVEKTIKAFQLNPEQEAQLKSA